MEHVIKKSKRKKKRKGTRERERERKRKRKRPITRKRKRKEKRKINRKNKTCFCKRLCFLVAPGSALEKMLQLWTLRTNLLKWTGPSHGPVPWNFLENLFFNKGLIRGLILLGKAWALNFAIAFGKGLPFFSWLQAQLWKKMLQLWTLRTKLKWTGPSHGPVPWKFLENLFFSKGIISGLILLGQGKKHFLQKKRADFFTQTFFWTKNMVSHFLAH